MHLELVFLLEIGTAGVCFFPFGIGTAGICFHDLKSTASEREDEEAPHSLTAIILSYHVTLLLDR